LRILMLVSFPREEGKECENAFHLRSSIVRPVKLPMESGIDPVKSRN
jgi:hypothetical protein